MATGLSTKVNISLVLMFSFYMIAGLNHFRDPTFYLPLIPGYIPYPIAVNAISGSLEVLLALGLLSERLRSISSKMLIGLLILLIPAHIHFIAIGACIEGGLCVPLWIAWFRLIIIHPLLIFWSYRFT